MVTQKWLYLSAKTLSATYSFMIHTETVAAVDSSLSAFPFLALPTTLLLLLRFR